MMTTSLRWIPVTLLLATLLAGCGQKGDLVLPESRLLTTAVR